jgi:NDP-sugar pyrophosphorylase family protein
VLGGFWRTLKLRVGLTVGEGTRIINSVVRGPSIIGEKCIIRDSYIGPYTSIGNNVSIIGSGVEYSVIMDNVSISGVDRLDECLVGRYSRIVRSEGNRRDCETPHKRLLRSNTVVIRSLLTISVMEVHANFAFK